MRVGRGSNPTGQQMAEAVGMGQAGSRCRSEGGRVRVGDEGSRLGKLEDMGRGEAA